MFEVLKRMGQKYLTPGMSKKARWAATIVRYKNRKSNAKRFYNQYKESPHPNRLFVAGLPKSGTTWLEKMLGSIEGYQEMMIPEAVKYEQNHRGSHLFDLPQDAFTRFRTFRILLKLHVHGSKHNVNLLKEENLKHVVVYRDLRDVAISHYHYVRQTPWHPEYKDYSDRDLKSGLIFFADTLLPDYIQWIDSWKNNGDHNLTLIVTYEQLLNDTPGVFRKVLDHFDIDLQEDQINAIIEKNSFKSLSGGRERGDNKKTKSFFRKGIAGDWVNHFDDEVLAKFNESTNNYFVESDG